jgi:hypothetical protein
MKHVAFSSFFIERYQRIKVLTYVSSVIIPIQQLKWRQCTLSNDAVHHKYYTQSVTGLSPGRPGVYPKPFYVKTGGQNGTGEFICQLLLLTHVSIIPPILHTHSSTTNAI